jgi:hypothetical protein
MRAGPSGTAAIGCQRSAPAGNTERIITEMGDDPGSTPRIPAHPHLVSTPSPPHNPVAMHPALGLLDRPAPAPDSGDFGALRARVLDAHVTGRPVLVPRAVAPELDAWAAEVVAGAEGQARGLVSEDVPDLWYDVLAWSGVPMSVAGPLRWGVDIMEAEVEMPEIREGALLLPPPPVLAQLTSLALRPLRRLVAERMGCRLQAATGLYFYLWSNQAVLVSRAEVPLGGFLHGPENGTRHYVSVPPGGSQVLRW